MVFHHSKIMAMDKSNKKPRLSSIIIDGGKYMTTRTEKYKNRKPYVEHDPNLVKSFIPGTIVEIMVKEGRKVEEGDEIIILEAMKMRNIVLSPVSGRVKKIYVKIDQMVSKNFLLMEME